MSGLPPKPILAARQIEVRYEPGAPAVLKQFTLAVRPGEFLGIIGPNGSGKSTLIRALSRALRPTEGVVLLDHRDLYRDLGARDSARSIGVVPQETAVSLDFSVREVVRMGRAPHLPRRPFAAESAGDEAAVRDALDQAGVADLADRAMTSLSGGEQQRVLVARTLAQQAGVLLLDEPTAHLDLGHQADVLDLARDLAHGQGRAVLAVLHDLNLASAYCDLLVLLHDGRIAAQGTPAEVLTPPILQSVYGARVWVRTHPATGRPFVLTLPALPPDDEDARTGRGRVHVLCGGGTGALLLPSLRRRGFAVTAGGLNDGDTDAEMAEMLGIAYAHAPAFARLSASVLAESARLAASDDAVLLTEVPFGPANLPTLQTALDLRRAGKAVICLQRPATDFAARDLVGGAASDLWGRLLAEGARVVPDEAAALLLLESMIHGNPD